MRTRFEAIPQAMAGFGAARRPAGEHHEHSGARNRPCGARRGCKFFEWVAEAPKGRASWGSAEGGCVVWAQPLESKIRVVYF